MNIVIEALKNSILITGLVMIMMLLIEYVNIQSRGASFAKLKNSPVKQVLVATLLGLFPGCVGGFAVVSLYTHKLLSFGALVAMMIASSGDEAFIMLAMIPQTAIIIFVIISFIAFGSGILTDKLFKINRVPYSAEHYELKGCCEKESKKVFAGRITDNLRNISKERLFIMLGIALFITAVVMGLLEHSHEVAGHAHEATEHVHEVEHMHEGHAHEIDIFSERWINLLFAAISVITLFLTASANEHFIKHHLWGHVIKVHLKSIFLWTFGALLVIQYGMQFLDIEHWIKANVMFMLLLAVLIGVIPESGPHMVFITMFAGGMIPFSVLLASSIVQDGHTALPLLAESKSSFLKAKLINMCIGFAVGMIVHFIGF